MRCIVSRTMLRTDRIVVFTIHWLYALPTDAGAVSRVLARL